MVVLGKHSFVFDSVYERTCDVQPFDPQLGTSKSVPIVDGAISYDCPRTNETYVLVFKNALYVPSMSHNLIPPFILREAGIEVNEVAKIHLKAPTSTDHAIVIPTADVIIPLQLHGIFSFFHSRQPTIDEVNHSPSLLLTPDLPQWNPYSQHFSSNEESLTDHLGDVIDSQVRKRHCSSLMTSMINRSSYESAVDEVCAENEPFTDVWSPTVSMAEVDSSMFSNALLSQTIQSHFKMNIGSTTCFAQKDDDSLFESPTNVNIIEDELDEDASPPPGYGLGIAEVSAVALKSDGVSADFLAKIWHVKHEEAVKVLDQSTQLCRKGGNNTLSRHYDTNDRMLRYRRLNSMFFTDTFFVTKVGKSSRGNTCAQLFVSDKGYVQLYPMKSKGDFHHALKQFCKDVGVPQKLVCDPSGEQTSRKVKDFCHQVGTTLRVLEESTQWANRAELYVGLFKESVRQDLRRSNAPMVLWDYCAERRCLIHNVLPKSLFQLNGKNPTSITLGIQPDISNICQFDWYDWCYYRHETSSQFPFQKESLGRVLGPFTNEGNEMSQAILQQNGKITPRRSCRRLTLAEINSPVEQAMRKAFDESIKAKFGDSMSLPPSTEPSLLPIDDFTMDDDEEPIIIPEEDPIDSTGRAIYEQPFTDALLHAEVLLPQGEEVKSGKVIGRTVSDTGDSIGVFNENPLLNTIIYDVQFPNGDIREYAANVIAQNMFSQVDEQGRSHVLLDSILDYSMGDDAVPMSEKYVMTKSGQRRYRMTTKGWQLLVLWKDGTEQWVPLKLLKEANPIEVAEFAVSKGIEEYPAFAYWVPYVLRKRDKIVASVNSRIRKTTHKYGIEVPTSISHAYEIDRKNNNTFWRDAIAKEMALVYPDRAHKV